MPHVEKAVLKEYTTSLAPADTYDPRLSRAFFHSIALSRDPTNRIVPCCTRPWPPLASGYPRQTRVCAPVRLPAVLMRDSRHRPHRSWYIFRRPNNSPAVPQLPAPSSTLASDEAIARLPAPKDGWYLARDTELKGFFVVVGKRKRTFTVQGDLRQGGKRTSSIRVAIGDAGEMSTRTARATAKDYLAQISRGQHPKANKLSSATGEPTTAEGQRSSPELPNYCDRSRRVGVRCKAADEPCYSRRECRLHHPAQTPRRSSAQPTASNQRGRICGSGGNACPKDHSSQLAWSQRLTPNFSGRTQRMRTG